jgi:hypothetical protein
MKKEKEEKEVNEKRRNILLTGLQSRKSIFIAWHVILSFGTYSFLMSTKKRGRATTTVFS